MATPPSVFLFLFWRLGVELSRSRYATFITSPFCIRKNGPRLPGLFVLTKRHQSVESPSHVHRSSVNQNCGGMYVSTGWIAAEEKLGQIGKQ